MHINKNKNKTKKQHNKRNCLNIAQASLDAMLLEFNVVSCTLLLFCNNTKKFSLTTKN